jgi:hypothetical protein
MLCSRRRACRALIMVKQNSIHTGHFPNILTIDDILSLLIKNPMRKNKINKKRKRTKCRDTLKTKKYRDKNTKKPAK